MLDLFLREGFAGLAANLHIIGLLVGLVLSIALITKSADVLVEGAVAAARRTGMPRVLIGATVVALGTSLPETFVSVTAAWMGNPGLALGNGVGSVICDTGLIFGMTCLLSPLPANPFILNRTGWVQVFSATLLVVICLGLKFAEPADPVIPRWVGVLFLLLLAGYVYLSYGWARQTGMGVAEPEGPIEMGGARAGIYMALGLVGVVLASRALIPFASELALRMGVPEDVIAATLVALGTSLPELTTALVAVRKKYPSIMLGTVVGSDVINILFVVGASAVASPLAVKANFFTFHFPAMLVILYTFRVFIFTNHGKDFKRWQGGVILFWYVLYLVLQYVFNLGV